MHFSRKQILGRTRVKPPEERAPPDFGSVQMQQFVQACGRKPGDAMVRARESVPEIWWGSAFSELRHPDVALRAQE